MRPTAFRDLLLPLTPAYRLGLTIRELRLRRGWERVRRLGSPVISIGNLSTGGAGKTPFAIALAKALWARGFAVDVLSRGYGRRTTAPAQVDPAGSQEEFGDEPVLMAREAGVPVYVAAERYEAGVMAERLPSGAKARDHFESVGGTTEVVPFQSSPEQEVFPPSGAKARDHLETNSARLKSCPVTRHGCVHILDDGFQHRQLHRDVDILLLNREDWHARLLPAGNLREPRRAAERADVIAIPANEAGLESELRAWGWNGPVWRLHRRMEVPQVDGPVVAFCGIARPEQFFAGLEEAGLRIAARIAFRDHHRYTARDMERLVRVANGVGANSLVTTQKDEIRLERVDGGSWSPTFATKNVAKMGHGAEGGGSWFPTFATKSVAKMGHGDFQFLVAGLRIEIQDEDEALGWLARRLNDASFRLSV